MGRLEERDSASSKLKLKNRPVFLCFFSSFLPSFEIALSLWMYLPIFWPVFVLVAGHPKSLPNGNLAVLTSCVGTAITGFGTYSSSIWGSDENPASSGKAWNSKAAGVLAMRSLEYPSALGLSVYVI